MKKTFFFLLVFSSYILAPIHAQRPHCEGPGHGPECEKRPDITELVSNLSSNQKGKLESITTDSKKRVERLRNQQKAVRDSIGKYMDKEGDHSKALFPLFEREARLQAEVSREMYTTKIRIDEVLTPEQRKGLKANGKRHQKQQKSRKK